MAGNSPKQSSLGVVAQYGCQSFAACVGKWPQSKVWNHLSSARVQKTTVACLLQEPSLIDFIYTATGGGTPHAGVRGAHPDRFLLSRHPGLIRALGASEGDGAVMTTRWLLPGPGPPGPDERRVCCPSQRGSRKLKAVCLVSLPFGRLSLLPPVRM